jgi:hypothetical protein
LLATSQEEREEAIKKLIPGSLLYYHLYFLDKFKTVGSKLSDQDQKMLDQFKRKYNGNVKYNEIMNRLLLLKYDDAENDE